MITATETIITATDNATEIMAIFTTDDEILPLEAPIRRFAIKNSNLNFYEIFLV
jgi:hypothetical protein